MLDQIHLSIRKGESVLLLGPSGSGKSTLGYVLGGLIPRSIEAVVTGNVRVEGRVGMLFQDPEAQFCMLTAEDEIAFGLENIRIPRREMETRIDAALERFGLMSWKRRNSAEMSGGMKQKLAMACLLAMEPDIYIFDEPTANLDPASTRDVLRAIRELKQTESKTLLIIEHKVEGVIDWVDRAVLLGPDGRLLDEGMPGEVFRRRQAEIRAYGIWQPTLWKWSSRLNPTAPFPTTTKQFVDAVDSGQVPQLVELLDRETGALTAASPAAASLQDLDPIGKVPLFRAENASFSYGKGHKVWGPISFDINAGEWVAIVGPNGCGKSTLLSALMGLRNLSEGTIRLKERPLDSYSGREISQLLGFVFQNPEHQFITDTVWQEVAFGTGAPTNPEVKERVRETLVDLGLIHAANANPFSLSQGEKRRLSVATTLLSSHEALLLDEPTFGQDAHTAFELEEKLADLHQQGRTLIMVTHDMELVARRAQKVLVLAGGNLLYCGHPADLFRMEESEDSAAAEASGLLRTANLELPLAFKVRALLERKGGLLHAGLAAGEPVR
ncbi:energy-coupling factor transport system ATP-binding protein [Effusibacillus lacus]|nr:energy-coupling factor transport system ATP-binding protein [Effusibacillus lacus]